MKIIAKRMFRCAIAGQEYIPAAIKQVILAPEWIREDAHFKALKRAGVITVIRDVVEEDDDDLEAVPAETVYTLADVKDAGGFKSIADAAAAVEALGYELDGKPTGKAVIPAELFHGIAEG